MEHLITSLDVFDLALDKQQLNQFAGYQNLLLEWNKRLNLTAVHTPEQIQVRHFADSLSCILATGDLNKQSLIDVGSGAGFPGIPLKIYFPELRLTLLESIAKKARFLQAVVDALCLEGVQVIAARAENIGHDIAHRQCYDWSVARAVANLSPLLEYLLPFCRLGGHALAQKGARAYEELRDAQNALSVLGGEMSEIIPVELTDETSAHLLVIKKIKPTPDKYPRRAGIPAKRPL